MLPLIGRLYVGLINALAGLAALLILFSIVFVIFSVLWRYLGFGAVQATIATVEYILLYFTILSAPYLLHTRGHVVVDMIVAKLEGWPRRILEAVIYIIGLVVCMIFTFVSIEIILDALERNSFDERSIDMPYWLLYAGYPLCFGLLSIEFARYLFTADSLFLTHEPKDGL